MRAVTPRVFAFLLLLVTGAAACRSPGHPAASGGATAEERGILPDIRASGKAVRPPYSFREADDSLLDEVQRGAFNYLWNACDPVTGMVYDRTSKAIISVGGVGFQLSAIPIAVERGWISADEGRERAARILRSLIDRGDNRKAGFYYHYLDPVTAAPAHGGYERVVSTIDSALLFAGAITAGAYFGGNVAALADRMLDEADWRFFVPPDGDVPKPEERGFVSLGWKPTDLDVPDGDGRLLPYYWIDSGDEHRLVAFLGACAPRAEHRLDPLMYYRLRRALGSDAGNEPFVWFPWSGALFTAFFAHCWIDYARLGPDDPPAFGVHCRPRVDWWENSRRIVAMHRRKAAHDPGRPASLHADAWGLSACDSPDGYLVPGLFPTLLDMPGCRAEFDYSTVQPPDQFGDGTIAPYAAGSALIFDPHASLAAMRHYRSLNGEDGMPLIWRDPRQGGYGFLDSYNPLKGWVAEDCVAIDQGPLILLIENARTGNVWKWFGDSPHVKLGKDRLGLR